MTNIEKALLSNVFPHVDITLLEEVINATPNTGVATEILCGIYLEPEVPQQVWNDDKTRTYIMDSFNKWTGNVSYHYFTPKKISAYFPPEVKKEDITEDNYQSLRCGSGDKDAYHHWLPTSEMEKSTTSMELSKWMKYHDKCPIDMFAKALEEGEKSIDEPHVVHQMTVAAESIH